MRYFLGLASSEGCLAGSVGEAAWAFGLVLATGSAEAIGTGLGSAGRSAVALAAVALRADGGESAALGAAEHPGNGVGQPMPAGGWTKAPRSPTLIMVVAT
jgi:hypothetical protein